MMVVIIIVTVRGVGSDEEERWDSKADSDADGRRLVIMYGEDPIMVIGSVIQT